MKIYAHDNVKQVVAFVSPILLSEMMVVGWKIPNDGRYSIETIEGVPTDAKYLRGFYDSQSDLFGLVFEHESFAETQRGQALPNIYVTYQQYFDEDAKP